MSGRRSQDNLGRDQVSPTSNAGAGLFGRNRQPLFRILDAVNRFRGSLDFRHQRRLKSHNPSSGGNALSGCGISTCRGRNRQKSGRVRQRRFESPNRQDTLRQIPQMYPFTNSQTAPSRIIDEASTTLRSVSLRAHFSSCKGWNTGALSNGVTTSTQVLQPG